MTKFNEFTVFDGYSLVATEIVREGMPIFAVVKYYDKSNRAEILCTSMDDKTALTMLAREIKKHKLQQALATVEELKAETEAVAITDEYEV